MNTSFKPCLFILTLALGITACSTAPFLRQSSGKPTAKAPVVDRSARRPPAYSAQPPQSSQADAGRLPQDDPLLPRERSSAYPPAPDAYGSGYVPPAAAQTYPNAYGSAPPAQPYRPIAIRRVPPRRIHRRPRRHRVRCRNRNRRWCRRRRAPSHRLLLLRRVRPHRRIQRSR